MSTDTYGLARIAELRHKAGLPERRAPMSATRVIGWTSPGQPMAPEWDAETAIRWGYMANVIAYRCIQIRAQALAGCPFLAGPVPPKRPGLVGQVNERSPLLRLLGPPPGGPAPKLTARRLWSWSGVQRLATGRHAWEIESNAPGGVPLALWPLVSAQLEPVPTTEGTEWWAGFCYGFGDNRRKLRADQVHYGWDPSATDFRQAEAPLQAARLDLSIAVMGDRYAHAFLKNDARPAAVVVTEAFGDDDEYVAFKRQWNAEYQGPDNAGRVAFLETSEDGAPPSGAIDVRVLGLSQKDAQFIEQHQASLTRVAMALGVPWSMLDASGRTFDNASEEAQHFWFETQLPWLSDLADEVNMQLAPRLGSDTGWFDLSHVKAFKPESKFTKVDMAAIGELGVLTKNEIRRELEYDPIPGGDVPIEPKPIAIPLPNPVPKVAAKPKARRAPKVETRILSPEQMEQRRALIWKRTDATVRTIEGRWQRAMSNLFTKQEKATLARLTGPRKAGRAAMAEGRAPNPDEVFDRHHWTQETGDIAEALYETVMVHGFARISDLFGVDFDLEAPWASTFVRNRANQLAGQVTDTTYQQITDALAQGVEAGDGIPELAQRIRDVFQIATDTRATTIARTEVISAFNGSTTLAAQTLPPDVAAGREWISTRDDRTREDHAIADGQVVPMDTPFDVGGEALVYPGDPAGDPANTVNCRCTVAILTPDEMAERQARGEKRVPVDRAIGVLIVARGRFIEPDVRHALEVVAA